MSAHACDAHIHIKAPAARPDAALPCLSGKESAISLTVGVPKETFPGERRVAIVPSSVPALRDKGVDVIVEEGAGAHAGFGDDAYRESGATVDGERADVFEQADAVLHVRGLGGNPDLGSADLQLMRPDQAVIGFLEPLTALEEVKALANAGVMAFAMELIPRTARAQSMDALTSMATIAGYKAVLLAAEALPRMFPMMVTAAGTLTPARVFVIGAGVAGLQAIATARRLGAVVQGYDIRPVAKEQVESLGARFVELALDTESAEAAGGYARAMDEEFYRRQRELMARVVVESDVVITTAAIPGKTAPVLVTADMVEGMQPGSVIVDLAAEGGGNCDLTQPGETVSRHGVTIVGTTNLPATVPHHASRLYSKNVADFLLHMVRDGGLHIDLEDDILRETLITRVGQVVHPRVADLLGLTVASGAAGGSKQ